jgi:uridine kinase
MNHCVVLSGLSGSGKSTIGKMFAEKHNYEYVDGDWFFHKVKPQVTLSSGEVVSNWDCPEAVDWEALNDYVNQRLFVRNVILVTFIPLIERYRFHVSKHITLSMGEKELDICIQARKVSKNMKTEDRIRKDELVVKEYVYPFYKGLALVDRVVYVTKGSERLSKESILERLEIEVTK